MKTKVTIVGYGIMGRAIAKAIYKNRKTNKGNSIQVFGVDKDDNMESVKTSRFVILSVKPQDKKEAVNDMKKYLNKDSVLISVLAGTTIKNIHHMSGHKKIIRMMPNLGLSVSEGIATWISFGLSNREKSEAKKFLDIITENFETKREDVLDKTTAISGSGPAYFFMLSDSLVKACKKMGLKEKEARKLVEKTFSAAAILGKKEDYSAIIKKVASKGGTTEAAIKSFKKGNFERIVEDAVMAAYERAKELSKK